VATVAVTTILLSGVGCISHAIQIVMAVRTVRTAVLLASVAASQYCLHR
jgi:hypothetical protein